LVVWDPFRASVEDLSGLFGQFQKGSSRKLGFRFKIFQDTSPAHAALCINIRFALRTIAIPSYRSTDLASLEGKVAPKQGVERLRKYPYPSNAPFFMQEDECPAILIPGNSVTLSKGWYENAAAGYHFYGFGMARQGP
jgi:hypothetical protein